MIDVKSLVLSNLPPDSFRRKYLSRPLIWFLRHLFHEKEFQDFGKKNAHLSGFDFIDATLSYFNFSYSLRENERERIPSSGRVVIVSNHPIGSLDGLSLLQLVRSVRSDVKIVANEILMKIDPLSSLLLPVDNMGGNTAKENVKAIRDYLNADGAVIIFPSGIVSRFNFIKGIRDSKWRSGFLNFASVTHSPILPIHIKAKNSFIFYFISIVAHKASTLWLVSEMFKHRNNTISIQIGDIVPYTAFEHMKLPKNGLADLFHRHHIQVAKGAEGVFATQRSIAPPENRRVVRDTLKASELLGETSDGKEIYLVRYETNSPVIRELGRLRELSFRLVEEGTGERRDIDHYDSHYMHLVLWDDDELEIAGAYRICDTEDILPKLGKEGLYSSTIFDYQEAMAPYFSQGLELGRSFVQPRYWGKRSLDYLWYGIGALCRSDTNYRYLFGAVSISDAYPELAKNMIASFYSANFRSENKLVESVAPFQIGAETQTELQKIFPGKDYKQEFAELKSRLRHMNVSVPTLFKQYGELCEPGGVILCDFGLDLGFSNALDGFVMVDTWKLVPSKRKRYIQTPSPLWDKTEE